MQRALEFGRIAGKLGEAPVGAVAAIGENFLCGAGNQINHFPHDPSAHAEMVVTREVAKILRTRFLHEVTLYTIAPPCAMCLGMMMSSYVGKIVYGPTIEDAFSIHPGWRSFRISVQEMLKLWQGDNILPIIVNNFMRKECMELLKSFRVRTDPSLPPKHLG